jgi:hypothetical protein
MTQSTKLQSIQDAICCKDSAKHHAHPVYGEHHELSRGCGASPELKDKLLEQQRRNLELKSKAAKAANMSLQPAAPVEEAVTNPLIIPKVAAPAAAPAPVGIAPLAVWSSGPSLLALAPKTSPPA